jgi:hypothetical protein
MQDRIRKRVSAEWTWITDYAYSWADWTVNIQKGRSCEVGTGFHFEDNLLGELYNMLPATKRSELMAWGLYIFV